MTELMGFQQQELERLLAMLERNQGLTDPDDVPDLPEEPETQPGDLWVCGKHRLLCGDATRAGDVARLLGDVKPNLMVTDPPYGVEYAAGWRDKALGGKPGGRATGRVTNDDDADWREAYVLFPGDVAYVWHAGRHASAVQQSLEANAFTIRCQIDLGQAAVCNRTRRLSLAA